MARRLTNRRSEVLFEALEPRWFLSGAPGCANIAGLWYAKPNAEGMMALASLRASGLWDHYWRLRHQAAA